jgi:dTDP-4-dehydrorhamnose reductase
VKVLVLGGSGLLGAELVRQASGAGHSTSATYATRERSTANAEWLQADLRHRDSAVELLRAVRPDVVINTAYRQGDWAATAETAANVAIASMLTDTRLIFVSSDAVFGGAAKPYPEGAKPDPISPYGAAKAAAETVVAAVTPTAVIARTSLIIGGDGQSVHERRVHDYIAGREEGVLFSDEIRCPIHVRDLASALLELAGSTRSGPHHLVGADALSRYELGRLIALRDGLDADRLRVGLRAESQVSGPLEVRLDTAATRRHLRTRLRGAAEFLVSRTQRHFAQ